MQSNGHEEPRGRGRRGWVSRTMGKMEECNFVESRGISPVPLDERTDTQYNKIFFLLFSANFNIFAFALGAVAPQYGLGLRDSCLVILLFNMICAVPPAYIATWGPTLGMRQMVQGRYAFGLYGIILPCILNIMTILGTSSLSVIVGGQTLASATNGHLKSSGSIVIITFVSLLLSFMGYTVLSWFERLAWIPELASFLAIAGISKHHFTAHHYDVPPLNIIAIFNYGVLLGATISTSTVTTDLTCYFSPEKASFRIFAYAYLGLLLPTATLQCFGAASAITASTDPIWRAGLEHGNVGGLIAAMLQPLGHFGKVIIVILALGVTGNVSMAFYSFAFNVQVFAPSLASIPRYAFALLATAIVIPISIVGSRRFYHTLANLLGLIAYWSSAYVGTILSEHIVIRGSNHANYDPEIWNSKSYLPKGLAALSAMALAIMMAILGMHSHWFVGPISKAMGGGDIGWELALVAAFVVYIPLRLAEVWRWGDVEFPPPRRGGSRIMYA